MSGSTTPRSPWWDSFVPGVVLLFGAVYVWWYLTEMERQPGPHRLPRAAVLLYNWGGKWGIVMLVASVGALFTAAGAFKLVRRLRERRLAADANRSPGIHGPTQSTETAVDDSGRADAG